MMTLSAVGAGQHQPPQNLIPVRGVPFGPLPPAHQPQPQAPGSQAQRQPEPYRPQNLPIYKQLPDLPMVDTDRPGSEPRDPANPDSPDASSKSGTLLPAELQARQAAAIAASALPPDRARTDIAGLAGEYSYGNGFDMNCTLEISEDGRFLFKRCNCDEVVDQATGNIKLDEAGQVVLEPTQPRETWPRGTAPVLVPVTWGQRLYLVPESDMIGFVNQVNLGQEPVTRGSMGNYYLREGDWDRPATGAPALPVSWQDRILKADIKGRIAGKDPNNRWIIDLGKDHGVYDNMELTAWSPQRRRFVNLRVSETGTDTSAVELLTTPYDLFIQGWTVYSRMSPPNASVEAASTK